MDTQPTVEPMNRAELERIAAAVFGATWKDEVTRHFDIRRTTLGRWIRDDLVPDWAAEQLRAMNRFPPAPREMDDQAYALGLGLMNERLDALYETAMAAGWPYEDLLEMVGEWLESKEGGHQHVGTRVGDREEVDPV